MPSSALLDSEKTIEIPLQISSASLGLSTEFLFLGSIDGSVRKYDLASGKVVKAIRDLGDEISSVKPTSGDEIWVACGRKLYCFSLNSDRMILDAGDAKHAIELCDDEEDILNELDLNGKESMLAFSTDSGLVGVVEISTLKSSKMKSKHESICGTVKFVPDRPRELVSGGYDSAILHFDFEERSLLSRRDITNQLSSSGMSMSPPFIMSTAMSLSGILAAGTADGQLWVGLGGEKVTPAATSKKSSQKVKKSRKWDGLRSDVNSEVLLKAVEGPIVALAFFGTSNSTLLASTLQGTIIQYTILRGELPQLREDWRKEITHVQKVNVLLVQNSHILVGGVGKTGKGCMEFCRIVEEPLSSE
ncbi:WD40 repeat-like protein [Flagelloscypha sp. PMI_526]|nr:WD40 repeat-like protein [Flagelloscypha sp. PMI_526]